MDDLMASSKERGREMRADEGRPAPRNLLEAKIRERNLTLDEFAEYALTRPGADGPHVFLFQLMLGGDGIWRIDGM